MLKHDSKNAKFRRSAQETFVKAAANVSNSLFLLEPCPIASHLLKQWSQRLSRQQLTFEYFSTSSRDSFFSWCNFKASIDAGYGSDSSDSDVLSCSSRSSVTLSSRPITSRSFLSSRSSEIILNSNLLERPKTAVARLLHSSISGHRAIKTSYGKIEVSVKARTADGYIHGIKTIFNGAIDTQEQRSGPIITETFSVHNPTPDQPLTVDQFMDTRRKASTSALLHVDQNSLEGEYNLGLHEEVIKDLHATAHAMRDSKSRWDDALHEAAFAHPSNHHWMDRNIRFAIVGNNKEFAVERELLKRDCIPRMKEAMWQLGYTLEMVDIHDGLPPTDSERQDQTVKIMNDAIQCFPFMVALMTDRDPLSLHKTKSWTGLMELILESGPLNSFTGSMWKTIAIYRCDIDRQDTVTYNDDGTFELYSDELRQGRLLQRMKNSDNVIFKKMENSPADIVKTIEREVMKILKQFCPAKAELEDMTDDWRHDYIEHDLASRTTASCVQPSVDMINAAMNRMALRSPPFPICLYSEDGFGLSSTISYWKHRYLQTSKVDFEFFHSFGATRASLDLEAMFLRLLSRMKAQLGIAKSLPNPAMSLAATVVRWLNAASSASYTVLIVLDGVHKATQGLYSATSWIPSYLPLGVKIVFSCPQHSVRSVACKFSSIECNASVHGSSLSVLHQFTQFCRPFPIQEVFLTSIMQACEDKGPLFTSISLGLLDVDYFHWEFTLEHVSQSQTVLELCTRLFPFFIQSCDGRPFICREAFALMAVSLQGIRQEDLLLLLQPYRPHFNEFLHNSVAIKIIEVRNGIWFWGSSVTSSVLLQCLAFTQDELYNAAIILARHRLQNPRGIKCSDVFEACSLYIEFSEPALLAETLKRRSVLLATRESQVTAALFPKWLLILEEISSKKFTAEHIVEHIITSLHVKLDLAFRVEVYCICCIIYKDLGRLSQAISMGARAISLASDLPSSGYAAYVAAVIVLAEIHEQKKDHLTGLRLVNSVDSRAVELQQAFQLQTLKLRLAVCSGSQDALISTAASIISIEKNDVVEFLGNDVIDLTIGCAIVQSNSGGAALAADSLLDAQAHFESKKPCPSILYCIYCCMMTKLCENQFDAMCDLYDRMDLKYRLECRDHTFPIKMLHGLAHVLAGRPHRAVLICKDALEGCIKVLGSDINTFQSHICAALAHALSSCGRYQESNDCLMKCISDIGRLKGYGHFDLLPLIDEAARTAQISQDCKTSNQWRHCAASIMEDAKAHRTSAFAFNRLSMIVCECMNAVAFGSDLSSLLIDTQRICDGFVYKMGWEHEIVYCAQITTALLELRTNRMTGCINRCRELNKKLEKWVSSKSPAAHWITLCNILCAQAFELQGFYEVGFKLLTDEAIVNRETFASDSDDLGMTNTDELHAFGIDLDEEGGDSRNPGWYSKLLHDLTLCRLAIRLRSYDYCISICQSWLSEFSAKNMIGAMAVAFGSFHCVSFLRKRKVNRSLLSSQVVMSLTFNDATEPINHAVSLVLKGGEALCFAWTQDYAQSLSSFEIACKLAKALYAGSRDFNAAALIQSFDQMAKLVCEAAEIKHRPLIDKYKIELETITGGASDTSESSKNDSVPASPDDFGLGLNVEKVDAGWMIVKVHEGWPTRAILYPRDTILRIDGSPCPSSLAQLQACLKGSAGSTVELTVQMAGSNSAEGVRVIRIDRRPPRQTKNAENTTAVFEKLLQDAAAACDDLMIAALTAQIRADRDNFV